MPSAEEEETMFFDSSAPHEEEEAEPTVRIRRSALGRARTRPAHTAAIAALAIASALVFTTAALWS